MVQLEQTEEISMASREAWSATSWVLAITLVGVVILAIIARAFLY